MIEFMMSGKGMLRGLPRLAVALVLLFLCGSSVGQAASKGNSMCGKAADAMSYLNEAMGQYPELANDVNAQKMYVAMVALESTFNTQAIGIDEKSGRAVSFGLGQVNYSAHKAEVDAVIAANGGPDLSKTDYYTALPTAGQWLLANPQQATNLGAKVYADLIKAKGGDLQAAALAYCGGCTAAKNYNSIVENNLTVLENCGEGMLAVMATVGGKVVVLECPESELGEALNKASEYYLNQSTMQSRMAANEATITAASSLGKKPLGDVRDTLCLRKFEKYMNLVKMLIGSMAGVLNMLIDWINQLLNVACQYVVAAINNALNSVCIPMPNLGSLPGFGGPDRKTCNGISLANILQFGVNPPYVPTFSTGNIEKYYNEKLANTPASRGVRDQSTRDTATKQ